MFDSPKHCWFISIPSTGLADRVDGIFQKELNKLLRRFTRSHQLLRAPLSLLLAAWLLSTDPLKGKGLCYCCLPTFIYFILKGMISLTNLKLVF